MTTDLVFASSAVKTLRILVLPTSAVSRNCAYCLLLSCMLNSSYKWQLSTTSAPSRC